MMRIVELLRRLFCRHRDLVFVRNIYGDEIVHSGRFKRSWWQCQRCGARKSKPELHKEPS